MKPEDFDNASEWVRRWIADYLQHSERYPVLAQVKPGEIRSALPSSPPEKAESYERVIEDFEKIIVPGVTHWNHPGFFAYFANTGSPPGVLAEMLSAALNINGMLWKTCPASTELEEVSLDWLRQMVGLPPMFGIIMDTASVASFCALAAARESLGLEIRERGMAGRSDLPRLRIYASEHSHSSIDKAAISLGFGQEGIRKIPADDHFRMLPDALHSAIKEDLRNGWHPACVVATVGTTSTTSIDPVAQIAEVCGDHGIWLHVDAAYAGPAAILPEKRWILEGCDRADSFLLNPHKWMLVPFDCTAFYTRHPQKLSQAFSLVPEYLRVTEEGIVNFMDYGIQLGRRFRSLKLWMVIRLYGVEGIREVLRTHIALAEQFASWVDGSENFERTAPVPLSVVCFRAKPGGYPSEGLDSLNEALMHSVNSTGEMYLSHTKLRNQLTLRLAIGNAGTKEPHIRRAWELLQQTLKSLLSETSAPLR